MKKLILIILMLLLACGCSGGKQEEPVKDQNKILEGKTFYNEADDYGNEDHAKVTFNADGSFVMTDSFFNGHYDIKGGWSVDEDVATLSVKETQVGPYLKIVFEVKDGDTLLLKTDLEGSKSGSVFTTTEVKGSAGHGQTQNSEFTYAVYVNASQDSKNKSYIELRDDGSCAVIDRNDFSISEANGSFVIENGYTVVMKDFVGAYPFEPKTIEFQIYDNETLILMNDLGNSVEGDVFSVSGTIPEALQGPMGDNLGDKGSSWRNVMYPDLNELYMPGVVFDTAGMFTFTENVYAGMAKIIGWYEKKSDGYVCHVDDDSQMQGFAGYGTKIIEFEKKDENTLILKTDLCMSRAGDEFELLP